VAYDVVPEVFGRSPAFTIVDIEDGAVKEIRAKKDHQPTSLTAPVH
jgi:predicted Fe-Mo cluster-binding NifX family protein